MRSSTAFLIGAVLALGFGVCFLLVPAVVLSIYGVQGHVATQLMGRFFGGALLQIGVTLWLLKETRDAATQRGLATGGAYMGQLRHKLERDPARPRLLITEPGIGYRLRAE